MQALVVGAFSVEGQDKKTTLEKSNKFNINNKRGKQGGERRLFMSHFLLLLTFHLQSWLFSSGVYR